MVRQAGTVTGVDAGAVTIKTATGAVVTIAIAPGAKLVQVPPGAKDLSAGTPATVDDVAVGDKVLANGTAPDAANLTAVRLIVMKSSGIEAMHAAEQRDWQRGLGGLVKSVDGNTITVASGARTLTLHTTPDTVFKRYAPDSVGFGDAQPGTLGAIHAGDQLRARGTVAEDRLSMTVKEVVTGSFENLSGVLSAVDAGTGMLTLKDLTTKKTMTVAVTAKSDLRNLPADAAARFAGRSGSAGGGSEARPPAGAVAGRRAGADLSQMLSRLPTETLADLKPGQAVMIVASEGSTANPTANPTAITLLSGVEAILSATPAGKQPITLSPWNIGGEGEGGGDGAGGPR